MARRSIYPCLVSHFLIPFDLAQYFHIYDRINTTDMADLADISHTTRNKRLTYMIELGLVAERLVIARRTLDLTQEEAAERSGISERTIQRYEAGKPMDLEKLDKLCDAYGVTIHDALGMQHDLTLLTRAIRRLGVNVCKVLRAICDELT